MIVAADLVEAPLLLGGVPREVGDDHVIVDHRVVVEQIPIEKIVNDIATRQDHATSLDEVSDRGSKDNIRPSADGYCRWQFHVTAMLDRPTERSS